eukprot:766327-Amphidinium_carterae.1
MFKINRVNRSDQLAQHRSVQSESQQDAIQSHCTQFTESDQQHCKCNVQSDFGTAINHETVQSGACSHI